MKGTSIARFFLFLLFGLSLLAAALFLASCSSDKGEDPPHAPLVSEEPAAEVMEQQVGENPYPSVDWYDYRYTFMHAWRDRDLNPNSEVVDYGGDYVHLRVQVTMIGDEHSSLKAPLQVLLNCKGREYRIFGKDYTRNSYIWRDYTDFPDEVGENHIYIVTMELAPYSRALNSSFDMQQAELVLNGIDWSDLERPQTVPLARLPLAQLEEAGAAAP